MKAPCKDCDNRHFRCHSECEAYIAYAEERERSRENKSEWREVLAYDIEQTKKRHEAFLKKKRR